VPQRVLEAVPGDVGVCEPIFAGGVSPARVDDRHPEPEGAVA
jgi:hypothetical protein